LRQKKKADFFLLPAYCQKRQNSCSFVRRERRSSSGITVSNGGVCAERSRTKADDQTITMNRRQKVTIGRGNIHEPK
jgi:hypothetical protein